MDPPTLSGKPMTFWHNMEEDIQKSLEQNRAMTYFLCYGSAARVFPGHVRPVRWSLEDFVYFYDNPETKAAWETYVKDYLSVTTTYTQPTWRQTADRIYKVLAYPDYVKDFMNLRPADQIDKSRWSHVDHMIAYIFRLLNYRNHLDEGTPATRDDFQARQAAYASSFGKNNPFYARWDMVDKWAAAFLLFCKLSSDRTDYLRKQRANKNPNVNVTPTGQQPVPTQPKPVQPTQPGPEVPHSGQYGQVPQPTVPQPTGPQPGWTQPTGTQPGWTQPTGNQPGWIQPTSTQPGWTQPKGTLFGWTQPTGTQPGGNQPTVTQPTGTQPGWTQSGWTQPTSTQPTSTQPGWTQPTGTQPGWAQPTGTQPGWTQPGWAWTQPTGIQPGGNQPTGTQPTGTQPGWTQPTSTQPTSTQPGWTQPTGTQPTGTQPTGTQPGGNQPTGTQPTGTQPGGNQPTGISQPTGTNSPDAGLISTLTELFGAERAQEYMNGVTAAKSKSKF